MEKSKEGPEFMEIPSQRQRVCGDCKYHMREAWMRGQKYCTDNYRCIHPDFADESMLFGQGREIAFNSSETPSTPSWCPFLNKPINT